ncbi:MAG: hypothetical protein M1833_007374 [Piccolia ochrophora]|nr:MAG: hypothetical protein M1833_007374 [Piccolia ochrophora]
MTIKTADAEEKTYWNPTKGLQVASEMFALLILNQPLPDIAVVNRLWQHSRFKICADGGANRLYDAFRNSGSSDQSEFIPDEVCGDLDSIRPEVQAFYEGKGVTITRVVSQYATDFAKCLSRIVDVNSHKCPPGEDEAPPTTVLVLGGLGGRVDQAFSQIQHLFGANQDPRYSGWQIMLFSERSISFVLHKGRNDVRTVLTEGYLTENIGIIPVGRPAVISTLGLEWDVREWQTEFGGQISTSNHIKCDAIQIHTNERVLLTLEREEVLPPCRS